MTAKEEIYLRVADGLAGCQRVELELKNYLGGAVEYIRKCIDGNIIYRACEQDFENHSLERLITNFRIYSDDDELIRSLNKFKGLRNNLTHQALMKLKNPGGDFDSYEADALHEEVDVIEREASRLSEVIGIAARGIWVDVWFDDETEDK